MADTLKTKGYLTEAEATAGPGAPSAQRRAKGKVACIECLQPIPCNPCEDSCKFGAITVGEDITNLPHLDEDKCTGCMTCLPICPGQAIFIIDESGEGDQAELSMPYEFRPLPAEGDEVITLDRAGNQVGRASVIKIRQSSKMDQTVMVTLGLPKEQTMTVRSFRLK